MRLHLQIWRQENSSAPGRLVKYTLDDVSGDSSFLEMLDLLNEQLVGKGEVPVVFEHDCREGICGACGVMINGQAHGPSARTATCQLHMRTFNDGDTIQIEPWRSVAFPVIRDLMVDRSSMDRIVQAGGFISVRTGSAPEANLTPVPKGDSDEAFDAAACIGCGACVAQCPNGAAQLFTSAKVGHLNIECEAVCPKGISVDWIARMNRDFLRARLKGL
jgi:succinate dehydrogenase / fumarate reductase iron-sulfur subunit